MTREESAWIRAADLVLSDMGFALIAVSLLDDRISIVARRSTPPSDSPISSWITNSLIPRLANVGWGVASWDASRGDLSVSLEHPRFVEQQKK